MKMICQLYMPSFCRSFGRSALAEVIRLLPTLKSAGFYGLYLIALWEDGGFDNGFDIVEYRVNPKFGTDEELCELIGKAHRVGLRIGVDIVPNHVSDKHLLARNCLNNVPGYEDCLYVVSRDEAECLTEAGVLSFFGTRAYSDFGDKYVRSTFIDYHQLNLNWQSRKVQEYFAMLFRKFGEIRVDFVRVDSGMLLFEDVTKASKENPAACWDPVASIEAIREVSGGMMMFFEWFDLSTTSLFDSMPGCYALDGSYILTGQQNLDWKGKLIPLLGGHDQMTVADRGIDIERALDAMTESDYGFLDMQTLIGWKTNPNILPGDEDYDANLRKESNYYWGDVVGNPNQRYRARRPIGPVIHEFRKKFTAH